MSLRDPDGSASKLALCERAVGEIARCWMSYGDRLVGLGLWSPARSIFEIATDMAKPIPPRLLIQLVRCDHALGEAETARQWLETLVKSLAGALPQALLTLHLARGASCAALELLQSDSNLARSRQPRELVATLHEAGTSRSDALDLLGRWAPLQAAELVESAYDIPTQNRVAGEHGFDPQVVINQRGVPNWQDWRGRSRAQLAAYLVRRDYQRFEALVRVAIIHATKRQIEKLHRHAHLRYPRSRLLLQLGYLLRSETVPADTPEVCRATLWRNAVSEPSHPVCDAARGFGKVPLLCTAMVRDENAILPDFFRHYAALGVRHFLILDNLSEDRPDRIAKEFPQLDITILRIEESYVETQHGMAWIAVDREGESRICNLNVAGKKVSCALVDHGNAVFEPGVTERGEKADLLRRAGDLWHRGEDDVTRRISQRPLSAPRLERILDDFTIAGGSTAESGMDGSLSCSLAGPNAARSWSKGRAASHAMQPDAAQGSCPQNLPEAAWLARLPAQPGTFRQGDRAC